jgi:membrane protein implicated in regulation of membrane protease activity
VFLIGYQLRGCLISALLVMIVLVLAWKLLLLMFTVGVVAALIIVVRAWRGRRTP